jgi:hypothetical protein
MYFSEILMCVNVLPYLHIREVHITTQLQLQTQLKLLFNTFIEKNNSQQSNNLKIYKKQFSHI